MQQSRLIQSLKQYLGLYITLLVTALLLIVKVVLERLDIFFLPLFRFSHGITLVLLVVIAVLCALLFVLVSRKMTPTFTFAFLCLSSIILILFFYDSPLKYALMTFGSLFVLLAVHPATYRYRWLYLVGAILFVAGVAILFFFYAKPVLYSLVIGAVIISVIYVFWPRIIVQMAASIWTLGFPSLILVLFVTLGANTFYVKEEDFLSFDVETPINTEVKVILTLEDAMIDQYLYIRVYQPVGLGFYSVIGMTYFEHYSIDNIDLDDFTWESLGNDDYQLSIQGDFATISVHL